MKAKSITKIIDENDYTVSTMYKYSDGYPECYGKDLATFLSERDIVLGVADPRKKVAITALGLAAQIIAKFKTETGEVFILPNNKIVNVTYTYIIKAVPSEEIKMTVFRSGQTSLNRQTIFNTGTPTEFLKKIEKSEGDFNSPKVATDSKKTTTHKRKEQCAICLQKKEYPNDFYFDLTVSLQCQLTSCWFPHSRYICNSCSSIKHARQVIEIMLMADKITITEKNKDYKNFTSGE